MTSGAAITLRGPQRSGASFVVVGAACVVAGGLLAAAVATDPTEHAVWAAAYLVLVAGVAQVAIGLAQAALLPRPPAKPVGLAELVGWNLGNAAVIAGTVAGILALTDIGGALLVAALASLAADTRGAGSGWWLRAYRVLLVLVLVSIPVGLVIGQLRAH